MSSTTIAGSLGEIGERQLLVLARDLIAATFTHGDRYTQDDAARTALLAQRAREWWRVST